MFRYRTATAVEYRGNGTILYRVPYRGHFTTVKIPFYRTVDQKYRKNLTKKYRKTKIFYRTKNAVFYAFLGKKFIIFSKIFSFLVFSWIEIFFMLD